MPKEVVNFTYCAVPVLMLIVGMGFLYVTWFTDHYWVNQNWRFFAMVSSWFFLAVLGGCFTIYLKLTEEMYTLIMVWAALLVNTLLFAGFGYLFYCEYTKPLRG